MAARLSSALVSVDFEIFGKVQGWQIHIARPNVRPTRIFLVVAFNCKQREMTLHKIVQVNTEF